MKGFDFAKAAEAGRNPDGTFDGYKVAASLTGCTPEEMKALVDEVRANKARLDGCAWPHHVLDQVNPGRFPMKFRCRHCGGVTDRITPILKAVETSGGKASDVVPAWGK